jgi:heme/copper-type cytochrome/quinol oxidase subunit 1
MGAIFALLSAFYYWIGKITGFTPLATANIWANVNFWLFTIAINLVFFPMHALGLAGMPRRIADYPDGYADWNTLMGLGSFTTALSLLLFLFMLIKLFTSIDSDFSYRVSWTRTASISAISYGLMLFVSYTFRVVEM